MSRPFLTARWQDLALITYAIDPALMRPHLPAGCEPDLIDGSARCSLVAFDFCDARVFGVRWPGHTDFPEVNLRFYVVRDGARGIVFLSEFVPRHAIAWIARAIYNEPYDHARMSSHVTRDETTIRIDHAIRVRGKPQRITVTADAPASVPDDPAADWLKEHRWGFGHTRGGGPLSYEVLHERWAVYPNATATLDFDFAHVYGAEWAILNGETPVSTLLAAGSNVTVSPRRIAEVTS